ncbi:MAG: HEAT repeat domain-containing protein [Gemmatimonadaceae bacterium]|nr:HEAT repeat domain-containing protein [Gemmatimonadaceae bacterium]
MKMNKLMLTLALGVLGVTTINSAAAYEPAAKRISQQDPADSLYRSGNEAMRNGNYERAAELFRRLTDRYPSSSYADRALYFEAFSLFRAGDTKDLKRALNVLANYQIKYPAQFAKGDATTLRIRVCQALAEGGDEGCAVMITTKAGGGSSASSAPGSAAASSSSGVSGAGRAASGFSYKFETRDKSGCPNQDEDSDERIAALNALLQMDAARAMPILKKVLARRDPCTEALRSKAVFLVSQKNTVETADILLSTARNDPNGEVRQAAVFWLSQVRDERAIDMLYDILRNSRDDDLREKALFSLSQHHSTKGTQILKDFAMNETQSNDLREKAIFWLGQKRSAENADFLRRLYSTLKNNDLKEKILFSLSQQRGMGNDQWLIDVARNTREDDELRKKALFWAGQGGASIDQLIGLYSQLPEREMRDQLIFVFSQRREPAAVTKILDIAKTDKDPELRKKAIFWLSQSRDPRVQDFLLELINR